MNYLNLATKYSTFICFALLVISCSSAINITKPYDGEKFFISPNKLIVKHGGCGSVKQDTFRAWLNKDKPNEQEITSFFSFSDDTWISENISLRNDRYIFTAHADVDFSNSGLCYNKQNTDEQEMFVLSLPPQIKIMPLGDSNTRGWPVDPEERKHCAIGYRYQLCKSLIDAGYNVQFVGNEEDPDILCDDDQYPLDFQKAHEGHYNKKARWLVDNINNILTANQPNVILLHIGTNDIRSTKIDEDCIDDPDVEDEVVPCTVWNVMRILDEIDTWEEQNDQEIIVFLALIIKAHPSYSWPKNYNSLVEDYNAHLFLDALSRINMDDDRIILVDMEDDAGIQYENDMNPDPSNPINLLHPLPPGYEKMADLWFRHLVNFLPVPE